MTSINDVTLCKLDVNVKPERQSSVAAASLNLSRNSLKKKCYFIAKSSLKIKCDKPKSMQEKVSIMGVLCG